MKISTGCLTENLGCCYTQITNINSSDITITYIGFSMDMCCFDVSFLFSDKDEMLQKRSVCQDSRRQQMNSTYREEIFYCRSKKYKIFAKVFLTFSGTVCENFPRYKKVTCYISNCIYFKKCVGSEGQTVHHTCLYRTLLNSLYT